MAFAGRKRESMWNPRAGSTAVETRDAIPSSENMDQGVVRGGQRSSAPPNKKTVVGPTGHSPVKTVATPRTSDTRPIKTVVGSTAQPPVKARVGNLAAPPIKTIVGNTAAPRPKTTPANLGQGGINRLGMSVADRGPINAANPNWVSRPLGNADANPGRSVNPMPPATPGPPNASLDWAHPWGFSAIQDGGMGPTAKRMGRASIPRGGTRSVPVRRSQFFGE